MEDKQLKKIQNDLNNNRKSINNHDDEESKSKKNKFLDDISDSEEDDSGEEEDDDKYELNDEFRDKVIAYVKADDKIREVQNSLKEYRKAKKDAEECILRHLERLGENMINITGGKLRKNQYESKEALKSEYIKEAITDKIKDVVAVEEILQKMESKRKLKINVSIKRTFEREGGGGAAGDKKKKGAAKK